MQIGALIRVKHAVIALRDGRGWERNFPGPLVARWEGDMRAFLIAMALARFSK